MDAIRAVNQPILHPVSRRQPKIRQSPQFGDSHPPAAPRRKAGILTRIGRVLLVLTALTGAGEIYETRFRPEMPMLNSVSLTDIPMHIQVRLNSTDRLTPIPTDDVLNHYPAYWRRLQPTRDILRHLSPEIAAWFESRYASQAIHIDSSMEAQMRINPTLNRLYIGGSFWQLSDGEKAAAIAHEYAHYRQGPVKQVKVGIAHLLSGKLYDYNNELEREAFLYHREALEALRLQDSDSYRSVIETLRAFGQIHRREP